MSPTGGPEAGHRSVRPRRGGGQSQLDPQLEALQDEFTVVAWDEPGVGRSSDLPSEGFGLADYAACLAAVVDAVGLGPAHIVGLSWGSTVALELFRSYPEVVTTHPDGRTRRLEGLATGARGRGADGGCSADARCAARGLRPGPSRALRGRTAQGGRPPAAVHGRRSATPQHADRSVDHGRDRPELRPPDHLGTHVARLGGARRALAADFEQAIPNATLVVISGCGHLTKLDRPDEINRAVREFCRRHSPAGD